MSKNELRGRLIEAFRDWLGKRIPDCRRVTSSISRSLDGKTDIWESLTIKLHLFACDRCARYLQHLRFLNRTFNTQDEKIADPAAREGSASNPEGLARWNKVLNEAVNQPSLGMDDHKF